MFEISVEKTFSSAHFLRNYRGKCENLHGHNWVVRLTVCSKKLDNSGMVFDFSELKLILEELLLKIDHKNINEIPPFDKINPSAENLAKYIFDRAKKHRSIVKEDLRISRVSVWESQNSRADYYELR